MHVKYSVRGFSVDSPIISLFKEFIYLYFLIDFKYMALK